MASNDKQYYELYRRSTVGTTLTDTLDQLISEQRLEPQLAMKIISNFDKAIADVLGEKVKSRLTFKGHLDTYRFCDDVWTFIIKDINFKLDNSSTLQAEKVRIVSCSSKKPGYYEIKREPPVKTEKKMMNNLHNDEVKRLKAEFSHDVKAEDHPYFKPAGDESSTKNKKPPTKEKNGSTKGKKPSIRNKKTKNESHPDANQIRLDSHFDADRFRSELYPDAVYIKREP